MLRVWIVAHLEKIEPHREQMVGLVHGLKFALDQMVE